MIKTALGTKAVGSTIMLKVNGKNREFLIVHQGKPSDIYDDSCNGTWLLMKDIYEIRQWHTDNLNNLENSAIHSYLNSTFLELFDEETRSQIKEVKIPYRRGGGKGGANQQGADGLEAKIFLLSGCELNFKYSYVSASEGTVLDYFSKCAASAADRKRIAYYQNTATAWWLRSQNTNAATTVWTSTADGKCYGNYPNYTGGVRPALILPSSFLISDMPYLSSVVKGETVIADYDEILEIPYDGSTHTVTVNNHIGTVTGTTSSKLAVLDDGCYEVYTYNTENDEVTLRWRINPITVKKPTIEPEEYDYDGSASYSSAYYKMPAITGYDSNIMTQEGEGTTRKYKAGEYNITFKLRDPNSCSWISNDTESDGGTDDYTVTWKINPISVKIPKITSEDFVYDGYSHSAVIENYNPAIMSYTGSTSGTSANQYPLTYKLRDPDSCTWDDETNTNNEKTIYWNINKKIVFIPKPEIDPNEKFTYDGTTHRPTIINDNRDAIQLSKTVSSIAAGEWEINAKLKINNNIEYRWIDGTEDGSKEDVILKWTVEKGVFPVPTLMAAAGSEPVSELGADILEFDYEGVGYSKFVEVIGYNPKVMIQTGPTSGYKAQDYIITFSLLDKDSAVWKSENGEDAENKDVIWRINKITVEPPTAKNGITEYEFQSYYAGSSRTTYYVVPRKITLELDGINNKVMSVSNNSYSYTGNYTAVIKLRDSDSCAWADETIEDKTIDWKIIKRIERLTFPRLEPEEFEYDGKSHRPELKNNDAANYDYWTKTLNGNHYNPHYTIQYKTKADKYTEIIGLRNSVTVGSATGGSYSYNQTGLIEYQWEDGSTDPIELEWTIKKVLLPPPTISPVYFDYDGKSHSITVNGFDSYTMTKEPDSVTSGTAAGEYFVRFSLKDKDSSAWDDGTENGSTDDIVRKWTIGTRKKVKIPTVSSTIFEYDGYSHSPVISEYDRNIIEQDGTSAEYRAGKYIITFRLIDETSAVWEDETTGVKEFEWEIKKKTKLLPKPRLDPAETEYQYNGHTFTPAIINYNNAGMFIKDGKSSASEAGNHVIIISLIKDDNNIIYLWDDETEDDITLNWSISESMVSVPDVTPTLFFYGGYTVQTVISGNKEYIVRHHAWRHPLVTGFDSYTMNAVGIAQRYVSGENINGKIYTSTPGKWYGESQWSVGKYNIEFTLKDPDSCSWINEKTGEVTKGKIVYEWSIVREIKLIPKPYLETDAFVYDGMPKIPEIINGDITGVITEGDLSKISALPEGYAITARLKKIISTTDIYEYRWEDNTTSDIILNWYILKGTAQIPSVSSTSFAYDGTSHFPVISGYDSNKVKKEGESQIKAGEYEITFSLIDPDSCTWNDGTSNEKTFKWYITKSTAAIPSIFPESIMYDGVYHTVEFEDNENDHSFVVKNYNPDIMKYRGSVREKNVNEYEVIISLKDPDSCSWTGGSIADITLPWKIIKKTVLFDKPYLEPKNFIYDGSYHSPEIINLKNEGMTVEGDRGAVNAKDYQITVRLSEDNNITYLWGDETSEPEVLKWSIEKIKIPKPREVTDPHFVYDGTEHSLTIPEYDRRYVSLEGITHAVAADTYSITFSLKNRESCTWEDDSTGEITYVWTIDKSVAEIPTVTELSFIYDKTTHSPKIGEYNSNIIRQWGIKSSVNAKEYTIVFSLIDKSSCTWKGGSTDDKEFKWEILKQSVPKPDLANTLFTYNGGTHTPTLKNYNPDIMKTRGQLSAVDANEYDIYISLKDTNNYQWDGETFNELGFRWFILKRDVDKPVLVPESFVYNGKTQSPDIKGYKSGAMTASGDKEGCEVGDYTIVISLNKNYQWTGGSTEILNLPWKITKITVPVPNVSDTEFIYDKNIHAPKIESYDINLIECGGTPRAVDSGKYYITFSLSDKEHCVWKNPNSSEESSEDISVEWNIYKREIEKPTVTNTHFVYNGGSNLPTIHGFDPDTMIPDGAWEKINAGNYIGIIKLRDPRNYLWTDKTTDILYFSWDIGRLTVEIPYLEPETFVYNAKYQSPKIKGFNENIMRIDTSASTLSARDVDEYEIVVSIGKNVQEPDGSWSYVYNYEWANGTVDNIPLTWYITPKYVKYPDIFNTSFIYDGLPHSPTFKGYIPEAMKAVGISKAVNADRYTVGFVLTDTKNYRWENEEEAKKQYSWEITPALLDKKLDLPVQNPVLIYNGTYQIPKWYNFNTSKLYISGVLRGRNVGEYAAKFTPTSNYTWSDGTREPVEVTWIIEKLGIKDPVQKNRLVYSGKEQMPEWDIDGALVKIIFGGDVTGINAGKYYVSCVCDSNCYFLSSGTDTSASFWTINKKPIPSPYAKGRYYFTGKTIIPEFYNYDPDILDISGDVSAIDIGDYIALFDIRDKSNYIWNDNVTLLDKNNGKTAAGWVILNSVKTAKIPYQKNHPVYNGQKQSPTWANYNINSMVLTGGIPFEINAGVYCVTFVLKNGYIWEDTTIEAKTVPWHIYKKSIPYPYIAGSESDGSGMYYYELEGKRYPVWRNYDPEFMIMSGDIFDIDNSWHTTYFDLKNKENYEWEDGRVDICIVHWKLTEPYSPEISGGDDKKRVHIPRQANAPIADGKTKYPKWDFYDSTAIVNLGGEWEGIEAKEYYVILELRDGYMWEDGTVGVKAVPWRIYGKEENPPEDLTPISIHIPKQINPPYYDGTVKQPEWDEWAEYGIDYKYGELYGVKAGIYYITISLKTGYIWEDGTVEDKVIQWVINPREEDPDIVPDNPRKPEPEKEEDIKGCGCCNCCCTPFCPDTGLFDMLNNGCHDSDNDCGCDC